MNNNANFIQYSACVSYHSRRVSVLESELELLTRRATAQHEGKDVLRRNYVT